MKKLLILLLIATGCTSKNNITRSSVSLKGEWGFCIDSLDIGVKEKWYNTDFTDSVRLSGSMAENGKGDEVGVNTQWTGDIVDRSYFTDKKYEKYRQPGNIKIPFWLKPVKYYKGVAWYSKVTDLPAFSADKRYVLYLERCHWQTTVYINGRVAGTRNSLSTPHEYDISDLLQNGKNRITIRVDNRVIIPVGVNSHSISDHTQTNWNGITGEISIRILPSSYITEAQVYPDVNKKNVGVNVRFINMSGAAYEGIIEYRLYDDNGKECHVPGGKAINIPVGRGENNLNLSFDFPPGARLWSEFNPIIYRLDVILKTRDGKKIDLFPVQFGLREFRANGTRFEVNSTPVFLRGTTECCVFPLTGYPPSDTASWMKIFRICREYGLNHMRFHSYCPPEAAFYAADRTGIYLHVECASWANQGASVGDGTPLDKYIYEESDRIIKYYGNHPSFCMLAYGNEPGGGNQEKYLGELINYWKSKDRRRVYTSGAGWPIIPQNDYNLTADPRIQHWDEGLKSRINSKPFDSDFDFRDFVSKYNIPVVGHEIGQWCVYPDFSEIERYKGVLKPSNLEIFRETLDEHGLGNNARKFLDVSGKLQVLCYKADMEAALRTPGFAGFQMLQLHDFPGQGTALVGILNPFFGSKGYVTPAEFREFCNSVVPLARIPKAVYSNRERFSARIEIANFSGNKLAGKNVLCQLKNDAGQMLAERTFVDDTIRVGNCIGIGLFEFGLAKVDKPSRLTFIVSIPGTQFTNHWNIWVYPGITSTASGNVIVTDKIDETVLKMLSEGRSVLLLAYKHIAKDKGAGILNGFSTIFWNTAWTNNQPPHTMGIYCEKDNPVFHYFPTGPSSDYQWWAPVTHSEVMLLDGFPLELDPLVGMVDTWFENRRLALLFEARTGMGKIVVSSIDFAGDTSLATQQLKYSVLNYMNSDNFNPKVNVDMATIKSLLKN